jgi:hypothetical protein
MGRPPFVYSLTARRSAPDQPAVFGATLRRRSRAAAASPNSTIIGGAGTSVPLVVLVLVELFVLLQFL